MLFSDEINTRGVDKTENAMAFVNAIDLRSCSATTQDTGKYIKDFVNDFVAKNHSTKV